jgi:hypothetical protein
MNPQPDVYAPLERVKTLWGELSKTPTKSNQYKVLADKIRAEASAYLAGVDAAKGADRRRKPADRRQHGVDPTQRRGDRRQSARRK